ncbi:MAG: zinc ribbon domain-containing protein [Planctomycetes bacterium]|nr:zinc ribbon domain-containing protein [Planctomycetota bacterium]
MNPNSETFDAGNDNAGTQATCEHCHLARTAGARFCPRCGRELTMELASAPPLKIDRRPENPGDTPPPTQSGSGTSGGSTPAAVPAKLMVPPPASKASTACKCGRILPEDSNFCPGCGASVSTDATSGYFFAPTSQATHPRP